MDQIDQLGANYQAKIRELLQEREVLISVIERQTRHIKKQESHIERLTSHVELGATATFNN